MPTIVLNLDDSSQDGRILGARYGPTITNVSKIEVESGTPYNSGAPIGGTLSSGGVTDNRGFLSFPEVNIPKGVDIESATLRLFAKTLKPAGGSVGTLPQQINVSAHTETVGATGQQTRSYTSFFTSPVRSPKGTITLNATETTFVEKNADVTNLVQELVDQFEYSRDEMLFRLTNKTFTAVTKQYNYPLPTPTFTGVSTQMLVQLYQFDQGPIQSPQLTIIYRTGANCSSDLCEDFTYGTESFVSRGLDDPAIFGNQTVADSHYVTSDIARIRINSPFPPTDQANRLDISCPGGVPHNASCVGDNVGGAISGGAVSDIAWNYRFKIDITSLVLNTDATGQSIHIGLSDSDETVPSDSAQDYIGFKIGNAGSTLVFNLIGANGIGPDTAGAIEGTFTTVPSTGVFFVELARLGTNNATGFSTISCALFNDKDYTDLIERVTGIAPAGIVGLNRLKFMAKNFDGTGNGDITVEYGQRDNTLPVTATGRPTLFGGSPDPLNEGHGVAREPATEPITFEDNFKSTAKIFDKFDADNWTDTGIGFGVSGGVNAWTADDSASNNATHFDIENQPISITSWVLRFKLDIDNLTNGTGSQDNAVFFGIGNVNGATSASVNQSGFGIVARINNTTDAFQLTWSNNQPLFSNTTNFTTTTPSVGTFYFELIRTSSTGLTANIYSDDGYKNLLDTVSDTITVPGNIGNNIKLQSRNGQVGADATLNGSIDDLQFWNARNTVPNNWTETGTKVINNTTNEQIEFDCDTDGIADFSIRDLGLNVVSENKWTLRWRQRIDATVTRTTTSAQLIVGIFSDNTNVNIAQDGIGMKFQVATPLPGAFRVSGWDGEVPTATPGADMVFSTSMNVGDNYYFELKRLNSTQAQATAYSDPDYTNIIERETITIPATITGLRYLRIADENDSDATARLAGNIRNLKFWNAQNELQQDNKWTEVNA